MESRKVPVRNDGRVIIHFDYDCFYASVFEAKRPALRALPFAVQQKQIIVTCNYEARRRGLHKLQLVRDAKRICPDVIIELGEDLTQFRDASKELYNFIKGFSWNGKVERLGFDEVWMDVTDIVCYNVDVLNKNDLTQSFFHLSKEDPTQGFTYDASTLAGFPYPEGKSSRVGDQEVLDSLTLRLHLGSHLSLYLRHQLEQQKGYTSTVGIATSKLLSKLIGNLHKPKGQTTLLPPLSPTDDHAGNVLQFLNGYEIGKIPGIGFKLAQKLRAAVLGRLTEFETGLVYGETKEPVTVATLRDRPEINPVMLERLLAGPGSPQGIGAKIWSIIYGVDDSEVSQARMVPRQISIEDSYIRLDTFPEVFKELTSLARSLLIRMRTDLLTTDNDDDDDDDNPPYSDLGAHEESSRNGSSIKPHRWLAHPRTIRLSTRPRQPLQPDGTRVRSFKRISHSSPLPNFVFSLSDDPAAANDCGIIDRLVERLVREVLIPMFRHLHPEKAGWNLSLVNVAVTNMIEAAGNLRSAEGRDIADMFRKQGDVLRDFRVDSEHVMPIHVEPSADDNPTNGPLEGRASPCIASALDDEEWLEENDGDEIHTYEDQLLLEHTLTGRTGEGEESEGESEAGVEDSQRCDICGQCLPAFAVVAHERFHSEAH